MNTHQTYSQSLHQEPNSAAVYSRALSECRLRKMHGAKTEILQWHRPLKFVLQARIISVPWVCSQVAYRLTHCWCQMRYCGFVLSHPFCQTFMLDVRLILSVSEDRYAMHKDDLIPLQERGSGLQETAE